ncbi:Mitogen-activated protein kinase kinase kinase 2 [Diplonema papillatum]|nr:Mitogen-activated protein kinase kinase kinase 2 [Diplonema papillatum]
MRWGHHLLLSFAYLVQAEECLPYFTVVGSVNDLCERNEYMDLACNLSGRSVLFTAADLEQEIRVLTIINGFAYFKDEDMNLTVGFVQVTGYAYLAIGTEDCPMKSRVRISFKKGIGGWIPGTSAGSGIVLDPAAGVISVVGTPSAGNVSLSHAAFPGDEAVRVTDTAGFRSGSAVVVTPSNSAAESEERTVLSVDALNRTLTFDRPLEHYHSGPELLGWGAAKVIDLTRNIELVGLSDEGDGPTITIHGLSFGYFSSVSLTRFGSPLGRTTSSPLNYQPASGGTVVDVLIRDSAYHCLEVHGEAVSDASSLLVRSSVGYNISGCCWIAFDGAKKYDDLQGVVFEDVVALRLTDITAGETFHMDRHAAGVYLEAFVELRGEVFVAGGDRGLHVATNALDMPGGHWPTFDCGFTITLARSHGVFIGGLATGTEGVHDGPGPPKGPFEYADEGVLAGKLGNILDRPVTFLGRLRVLRACSGVYSTAVPVVLHEPELAGSRVNAHSAGRLEIRGGTVYGSPEAAVYPAAPETGLRHGYAARASVGVAFGLGRTVVANATFRDFHDAAAVAARAEQCPSPVAGVAAESPGSVAVFNSSVEESTVPFALLEDFSYVVVDGLRGQVVENGSAGGFDEVTGTLVHGSMWWTTCAECKPLAEGIVAGGVVCETTDLATVVFESPGLMPAAAECPADESCELGSLWLFGRETDPSYAFDAGAPRLPFTTHSVWRGAGRMGWYAFFDQGTPLQFTVTPVDIPSFVILALGYPDGCWVSTLPDDLVKKAAVSDLTETHCSGIICYVMVPGMLYLRLTDRSTESNTSRAISVEVTCGQEYGTTEPRNGVPAYRTGGPVALEFSGDDVDTRCSDDFDVAIGYESLEDKVGQKHRYCDPRNPGNEAALLCTAVDPRCAGAGSVRACFELCKNTPECLSFNYHHTSAVCLLVGVEDCEAAYLPFSAWVYYPAATGVPLYGFGGVVLLAWAGPVGVCVVSVCCVMCFFMLMPRLPPTPLQDPLMEQENVPAGQLAGETWRLAKIIGRGAFAVVYKGYYIKTGEGVAVKVIGLPGSTDAMSGADKGSLTATGTGEGTRHGKSEGTGGARSAAEASSSFEMQPVELSSEATAADLFDVRQGSSTRTGSNTRTTVSKSSRTSPFDAELREVERFRKLSHPNIVQYYSAEIVDDHLCILMELVVNGSVAALIRRIGSLPLERARRYTVQMMSGIHHLHKQRILHRDIKGENLLLTADDTLKVSDFGCSKFMTELQMTAANTVVGTPRWMAPEVITSPEHGYGFKADIWSAACTVCEMLTGQPPWPEFATAWSSMYHIVNSDPEIPDAVDPAAAEFMKRLLQRDPAARPSADAVCADPWLSDATTIIRDTPAPHEVLTLVT